MKKKLGRVVKHDQFPDLDPPKRLRTGKTQIRITQNSFDVRPENWKTNRILSEIYNKDIKT